MQLTTATRLAQVCDSTFGRSSSYSNGASIRTSIAGETLTVKYIIIVNCGNERNLIEVRKRETEQAAQLMTKFVENIKSSFKTQCGKSVSLKKNGDVDVRMDTSSAQYSQKRTIVFNATVSYQIGDAYEVNDDTEDLHCTSTNYNVQQTQKIPSKRLEEIVKCGKEPIYFMNKYVKIQHPVRGSLLFKTYPYQDDCVREFVQHRFNVVVKSRQLGLSTICAGYVLWYVLFHRDKNVIIIANKGKAAKNFLRKVKYGFDKLADSMKITGIVTWRDDAIVFSNGSQVQAVNTTEDAGRSEAVSLLICDEAAHIEKFEEIWTAIYPTLTTGGSAIVLSTPKGMGNQFHKLYSEAVDGVNDFNPIDLPWTVHPEHNQAWFDNETKGMSRQQIAQEMLCDFVSSGDTFLQHEEMDKLRGMLSQPIAREGKDHNVWVWKSPEPAHTYIISADVARGDAFDNSTFHILDCITADVVAEYRGKLAPDTFGDLMVQFGKLYNNALLCPENNSFGFMTQKRIKDLEYTNLYYESKHYKTVNGKKQLIEGAIAGITTSKSNRNIVIGKLGEMIRNNKITVHSQRFVDEMKTFVWLNGKAQAMKSKNDDLVISMAILCWVYSELYSNEEKKATSDISEIAKLGISTRRQFVSPIPVTLTIGVYGASSRTRRIYTPQTHMLDPRWVLM